MIDFTDLKAKSGVSDLKSEVVNEMAAIDQHFITQTQYNAIKRGNGYQIAPDTKEEIQELVFAKTQDKLNLKKWLDSYLPQLKTGADLKSSKSFKEALKKGVPREVRGEVWQLFLGNALRINQSLYDALLARVRTSEANIENDIDFRKNIKVIEEDLHRTYTDLGYFRHGNKLYQPLKNILAAFSVFRPDVGYVQGMSYVAGSLLMHTGDEFACFQCFANMMNLHLMHDFYSFDMVKVNVFFHCFMRLLKERLPRLANMFVDLGL